MKAVTMNTPRSIFFIMHTAAAFFICTSPSIAYGMIQQNTQSPTLTQMSPPANHAIAPEKSLKEETGKMHAPSLNPFEQPALWDSLELSQLYAYLHAYHMPPLPADTVDALTAYCASRIWQNPHEGLALTEINNEDTNKRLTQHMPELTALLASLTEKPLAAACAAAAVGDEQHVTPEHSRDASTTKQENEDRQSTPDALPSADNTIITFEQTEPLTCSLQHAILIKLIDQTAKSGGLFDITAPEYAGLLDALINTVHDL